MNNRPLKYKLFVEGGLKIVQYVLGIECELFGDFIIHEWFVNSLPRQ